MRLGCLPPWYPYGSISFVCLRRHPKPASIKRPRHMRPKPLGICSFLLFCKILKHGKSLASFPKSCQVKPRKGSAQSHGLLPVNTASLASHPRSELSQLGSAGGCCLPQCLHTPGVRPSESGGTTRLRYFGVLLMAQPCFASASPPDTTHLESANPRWPDRGGLPC